MSPAALLQDLRARAFRPGLAGARRMGAEAEMLVVDAATERAVPVRSESGPCSLPLLRRVGALEGWREGRTAAGAPTFQTPDGGTLSFEPGGQLEFSSPPAPTVDALVASLHAVVLPLRAAAELSGLRLLAAGLDPRTAPDEVPLQLDSERYLRMDTHFARTGPAGRRMMRQTAAFQVNLDWEEDPRGRWRLLNAAAPWLTAMFASSPLYRDAPTGARSFRALTWRELDPSRTGIFAAAAPEAEYLEFALGAGAILLGATGEAPRSFRQWLGAATPAAWAEHLSTLFPEVRPKGYMEVRAMDAVAPEHYAAPLVLLAGLCYHPTSRAEAEALLGPPDPALLRPAAVHGLAEPSIGGRAVDLVEIALRGARCLPDLVGGASLEAAEEFFRRYTRRRRCPADDLHPGSVAALQTA